MTATRPPPSPHEVPANSTRLGVIPHAPRGARHWGGNRAVASPPRTGAVHVVRRREILGGGGGGQAGGTGVGAHKGHPEAPADRGRSNTATHNTGATPGGTRASAANKEEEEEGSEAREATMTAGTRNQKVEDGRACA